MSWSWHGAKPGAPIIYGKDAAPYFLRRRQNPSPSAALWRRLPICHVRSFPLLSRHFIICLPHHHKPHDSSIDGYELWREIYLHPAVRPLPPTSLTHLLPCDFKIQRARAREREETWWCSRCTKILVYSLLKNNSVWYKGYSITVSCFVWISGLYYKNY